MCTPVGCRDRLPVVQEETEGGVVLSDGDGLLCEGVLVEAVSGRVVEETLTLDLAARAAGEGMALAASVSASKSRLSRFIPLRSAPVLVAIVLGTLGVVTSWLHSIAMFLVVDPFSF